MQVHTKATDAGNLERGVGNAVFLERALGVWFQVRRDHLVDVVAVQDRARRPDHASVDAQRRRLTREEDQVAGVTVGHQRKPRSQASADRGRPAGCRQFRDEAIEVVG